MAEKKKYRSSDWYNSKSHRRDTFVHRGRMRNQGHPDHLFDGRPVIGICNTWSELTPCNGHFREIADSVKKGTISVVVGLIIVLCFMLLYYRLAGSIANIALIWNLLMV